MGTRPPVSEDALGAARERASGIDPLVAAAKCGVPFEGDATAGAFVIPFFSTDVRLEYPALDVAPGTPLPPHIVALLVYHVGICDGSMPTGDWVPFADLPNGAFYSAAFRGYSGNLLARRFAGKRDLLEAALASVGAQPVDGASADGAWTILALPRMPLKLLWWDEDDEFEAGADIHFDRSATQHLTLDGCAILGSWLTWLLSTHAGLS